MTTEPAETTADRIIRLGARWASINGAVGTCHTMQARQRMLADAATARLEFHDAVRAAFPAPPEPPPSPWAG